MGRSLVLGEALGVSGRVRLVSRKQIHLHATNSFNYLFIITDAFTSFNTRCALLLLPTTSPALPRSSLFILPFNHLLLFLHSLINPDSIINPRSFLAKSKRKANCMSGPYCCADSADYAEQEIQTSAEYISK